MMKGYIIVEIDVHNSEEYEAYKLLTPASLQPFGGSFLVRGGNAENLEGDWQPKRIVVLEFPSIDKAREWWSSEDYAPAKQLRQHYATTRMIAEEGVNEV